MSRNTLLRLLLLAVAPLFMAPTCEGEVDPHCHSDWKEGDPMPEFTECHGTRTGGQDAPDAGARP